MSALDDFLAMEVPDVDDDTIELEPPADAQQAEWYVRKLARIRKQAAENEAIAHAEIARIRLFLETENGKLARQAGFYEQALEGWHRAILDGDPTRKTITLPAGVLKARKHPDQWDVDAEAFVEWAREHAPHLVRTKHEPAKTELKKYAITAVDVGNETVLHAIDRSTGEPIPGVTVRPGGTAFTVDTEVKH